MSNLFSSIRASVTSLEALQRTAATTENNVANASTPGYAKQRMKLASTAFNPSAGLTGGVVAGALTSSRDQFVEAEVREQASQLGNAEEKAAQLAFVEAAFDLNDSGGVSPNLDKLFAAFSAWTVAPSSVSAEDNIIAAAKDVAGSFNRTAQAVQRSGQGAETRIRSTLDRINDLADRIRQHNVEVRKGAGGDAGLDASVHRDLEELSGLVEMQTIWQADGTATVLIGKETALVMGDRRFEFALTPDPTPLPANLAGAAGKVLITAADGSDVTSTFDGGKIGALLEFRNGTIPAYLGSAAGPGDLNRLAKTLADRVNTILTAGDPNPALSVPMFRYSNDVSAAATLEVNPAMQPSALSASDPLTATGNGRALSLAELARPSASADMIDNLSFVGFFGKIAADAGRLAGEASQAIDSHTHLLSQARTIREQISGVSLDEEAVNLVAIQRAYQATSRVITVLDEITQMAVNIGRA